MKSVIGPNIQIKGMIDLHLKLGSLEKTRTFIVVDRLHVDAILRTDMMKAFRTVINLACNAMTLKDTGFPAWVTTCGGVTSVQGKLGDISTVWWAGYSRNRIQGDITEATTVLAKGLPELDDTMKIA
ncbi:hypothetical protein PC118_g16949 [Phytophthora cactorum]|uniref:Uncharacterized protein n=2 Tax=Phytophthora cactorum TaxID=29920 RepID=A0A329RL33_9STRA|nr:hypothetical protein PC118_g16949 [Phytophthora cactorum]KAG2995323.1 hypothetical protein PC119_g18079 [Phytophthora cactorum]RAW23928.1 hypothetical protein PC110_g19641 [Phytophthora cactorum]